MTLTTHAIVGAAMASLVPQEPVLGFVLGFISHFALDSIPHWAEGPALLRSMIKNKQNVLKTNTKGGVDLVHDMLVVSADSLLGIAGAVLLFFYLFHVPLYIVLLGAVAGQTPDGLQFIYFKTHWRWMDKLQLFHNAIQEEYASLLYLLREAGIIGAVVVLGLLGAFVV
ncbi:MAG TPA: hypothetical protein VIJ88_02170 [Candidatus Paceibacterota bacterium]